MNLLGHVFRGEHIHFKSDQEGGETVLQLTIFNNV